MVIFFPITKIMESITLPGHTLISLTFPKEVGGKDYNLQFEKYSLIFYFNQ